MRSLPSDPDIQTIVRRIADGDINLQPNFQRGEVWGRLKQQKLIDTVLRDWHIPPIHVIESANSSTQEVLDGQQRLAAIRDFVRGDFAIDGEIEPYDERIAKLDGLKYRDLPIEWRRHIDKFTIRVFRIVDFKPAEPGELFFRLNQPTSLTAAEQRNAYFGPVRQQIKQLVDLLERVGLGKEFFGFSNSRMAYDDVLARVAMTVEKGSLAVKVTASALADLYRGDEELSAATLETIEIAIHEFRDIHRHRSAPRHSFNKATVFSWFMFVVRRNLKRKLEAEVAAEFLKVFELERVLGVPGLEDPFISSGSWPLSPERLMHIYDARAASRVADVSSVLLRDAVIWKFFEAYCRLRNIEAAPWQPQFDGLTKAFNLLGSPVDDDDFAKALVEVDWGRLQ